MNRIQAYRVAVVGYPTDAIMASGICVSYFCKYGERAYWIEGYKQHVLDCVQNFKLSTLCEIEPIRSTVKEIDCA